MAAPHCVDHPVLRFEPGDTARDTDQPGGVVPPGGLAIPAAAGRMLPWLDQGLRDLRERRRSELGPRRWPAVRSITAISAPAVRPTIHWLRTYIFGLWRIPSGSAVGVSLITIFPARPRQHSDANRYSTRPIEQNCGQPAQHSAARQTQLSNSSPTAVAPGMVVAGPSRSSRARKAVRTAVAAT